MTAKEELLNGINDILKRLEAVEDWVRQFNDTLEAAKAAQAEELAQEAQGSPLGTPETMTQGWLASRWQRRAGTVYGPAATQADAEINSAIRGGDDAAKIERSRREHAGSADRGALGSPAGVRGSVP